MTDQRDLNAQVTLQWDGLSLQKSFVAESDITDLYDRCQ